MKKYLQKCDTLGLVLLVVAVLWYSVSDVWGKWNLGLAIAGAALVIVGIAVNYRQIISSFGKRSTKHASNYVISLLLVIAIVSGLNYIGQKHTKRFDTTSSGLFTLAPQTVQVLENLGDKVEIKAFFPGGDYAPLQELLVGYRTESNHIEYEFIDPDRQPDVAEQYDVSVYGVFQNPFTGSQLKFGTVVVSHADRTEKIEKRSEEVQEEDLTNAIIKVRRTEAKKIYFIQGHDERNPSDSEPAGFSAAKTALEDQGYQVDTIILASENIIPEDAKVLIWAGPELEPFPRELELVEEFLNQGGGSVLLMLDPTPAPSFDTFLNNWGLQPNNDLVLDVSGAGRLMGTGPEIPLVLEYEAHQITDRFSAMTFFPFTRSIQPLDEIPEELKVETLFYSNPNSWGETNLNNPEAEFDPETDLEGPLSLAVAVSKETKPESEEDPGVKARMVVTGTSRFPINAYFPQQGNGNLFLNMVSWLAEDEDLISIRPKPEDDRRILLSQSQLSMLRLITLFVLPGIALVVGIVVVLNRRRK